MDIKQYFTIEEIRRDFTKVENLFESTIKRLEQFLTTLAHIQPRIVKSATKPINLRDSTSNRKRKIHKVNIPERALKKTEVEKNFQVLEELLDQQQVVNNMLLQLEQNFDPTSPSVKRMLKDGKKLKEKIKKNINKANKIAEDIATRNIPSRFKSWATRIYKDLEIKFKGRFDQSNLRFYVAMIDKNQHHAAYIKFTNLINDDKFTYPKYYVVITQVVNPSGEAEFYTTALSGFKLPGKFRFGAHARDLKQLKILVADQFALDKFVSKIAGKPMPLTTEQVEFKDKGISKTVVKDNKIYVTLKRMSKVKATELAAKISGDLQMMVRKHHPRNRDMIRRRVYKSGNFYKIVFAFTLPRHYKGLLLKDNDRKTLQEQLGLNDRQIKKVQEALDDE